jgi:hypothetical protein
MNECEALVQWYWQGKTKYFEKNLSQCFSVHHTSHTDWSRVKPGPQVLVQSLTEITYYNNIDLYVLNIHYTQIISNENYIS